MFSPLERLSRLEMPDSLVLDHRYPAVLENRLSIAGLIHVAVVPKFDQTLSQYDPAGATADLAVAETDDILVPAVGIIVDNLEGGAAVQALGLLALGQSIIFEIHMFAHLVIPPQLRHFPPSVLLPSSFLDVLVLVPALRDVSSFGPDKDQPEAYD